MSPGYSRTTIGISEPSSSLPAASHDLPLDLVWTPAAGGGSAYMPPRVPRRAPAGLVVKEIIKGRRKGPPGPKGAQATAPLKAGRSATTRDTESVRDAAGGALAETDDDAHDSGNKDVVDKIPQ